MLKILIDLRFFASFVLIKILNRIFKVNVYNPYLCYGIPNGINKKLSKEIDFYIEKVITKPINFGFTQIFDLGGIEVDFSSGVVLYQDVETYQKFLRLKWLPGSNSSINLPGPSAQIVESFLILFIKRYLKNNGFIERNAYNLSEAIVSIQEYLKYNNQKIPNKILQLFVKHMGYRILRNLEIYPGDLTGNHVINNARGLICAYSLTHKKIFLRVAIKLLEDYAADIFDEGYLKEGSSHYQFIVVNWLLDIRSTLKPLGLWEHDAILIPAIQVCEMLLVRSDLELKIPMIGDISPDLSPDAAIRNYYSETRKLRGKSVEVQQIIDSTEVLLNMPERMFCFGDIIRFQSYNYVLFTRVPKYSVLTTRASHEHKDFGSISVFKNGLPLILDPGRRDYTTRAENCPYVQSNLHNFPHSISETYNTKRDRFRPTFFRKNFGTYHVDHTESVVSLISAKGTVRRKISLAPGGLNVEDKVLINQAKLSACFFVANDEDFVEMRDNIKTQPCSKRSGNNNINFLISSKSISYSNEYGYEREGRALCINYASLDDLRISFRN